MFKHLVEKYLLSLKWQIFTLALLFLIFGVYSAQFHAFAADEYTYMNSARAFTTGDYNKLSPNDLGRFPGFPFILSLGYRILGDSEITGRMLNALLLFAIAITTLFLVYSSEKDKKLALAAAALVATNPLMLFLGSRTLSEPLFIFILLLCAWTLLLSLNNKKWLIALGMLIPALILTRFFGLYFLPIAIVFLLWKNQLRETLLSKWLYSGIVATLLVTGLWIAFNLSATGQAAGQTIQFIHEQITANAQVVAGSAVGLGLPDKIPAYLLTLPFLLGAPMIIIALLLLLEKAKLIEKVKNNFSNNVIIISVVAAALIFIIMEIAGFFGPRLLRYIAVTIPFLAILFAAIFLKIAETSSKKELLKKVFAASIVLNLIIGFGIVGYFGTYEKHLAYREAGLYAKNNCESYNSNLDYAMVYYTNKAGIANSAAEINLSRYPPECFVLSSYDELNATPSAGYGEVYKYGQIAVYKK